MVCSTRTRRQGQPLRSYRWGCCQLALQRASSTGKVPLVPAASGACHCPSLASFAAVCLENSIHAGSRHGVYPPRAALRLQAVCTLFIALAVWPCPGRCPGFSARPQPACGAGAPFPCLMGAQVGLFCTLTLNPHPTPNLHPHLHPHPIPTPVGGAVCRVRALAPPALPHGLPHLPAGEGVPGGAGEAPQGCAGLRSGRPAASAAWPAQQERRRRLRCARGPAPLLSLSTQPCTPSPTVRGHRF